jgi:apolipoprotein N-acyltransferase
MQTATLPIFLRSKGWAGRSIGFALGGLCVLGQAPLHIWPIALLGFAVFFMRLQWASTEARPAKSGFHSAFWFALGYFGIGVFWVGSAFIERGPAFIPVMPPMVLALAAILSLFWAIAGMYFAKARFGPVLAPLGFTVLFTTAEMIRGYAFSGLPWNLTGYIFPAGGSFSQGAALWTIYGQTMIVFALSAAIASLIFSKRKIIPVLCALSIFAGLYGFGALRLSKAEIIPQENILLRIVSVPFNQADKFDPNKSSDIVDEFIRESLKDTPQTQGREEAYLSPLSEVTHIIWPEGAVSGLAMDNDRLLFAMGRELAARLDGALPIWLLNSLRFETRRDPKNGQIIDDYYNSSVAVTFDGNGFPAVAGYNDKAKLVPFGEFIPFGKWMEAKNVPLISTNLLSISAASEKRLAKFPGLPVGSPQLCYEIIFPALTPRPSEGLQAEFILNQSNDAWFGKSWGPAQHANIARYRAIEEGLPVIRAASNGISGVFDPYGRVLAQTSRVTSSHIDVGLPKPLENHGKTKHIIFLLFLINLILSVLCVTIRRDHEGRAII